MKFNLRKLVMCAAAMVIVGVISGSAADGSPALERRKAKRAKEKYNSPVGEGEYYTTANIWYERPDKILSTNFHKGAIIPIGTKVIIDYYRGTKIKFTEVGTEATYTYLHAKKHSNLDLRQLFDRYFSKEDPMRPGGPFEKLSSLEKKNVKDGTLDVGMSKDAALMAYGYPPTHQTSSISNNVWTYWKARAGRFLVTFRDGKISNIQY